VGKLAGISHLKAIRAFERAGFKVVRQSKHVVLSNGKVRLTIPRGNPIDAFTMGGIVKDAGLTIEEFKKLL
jgi:predicted RNA binding protein YcfA (HicA-like mRNA interferase family)